jgi:hypothetical protein
MYIMAPEPISAAYFINPSHQSVCLHVYPLSLLGKGLVKIPLLLGSGSVKCYDDNEYTCNNRRIVGCVVFCAVCIVSSKVGN